MFSKMKYSAQERVELSEEILKKILRKISSGRISELANDIGLPYDLVYNLVHGRINSISTKNYGLIFGEEPPYKAVKRVDSAYFREMVQLWIYLNTDASEAELYREFYRDKNFKKVDYRIFSEVTQTVEKKLEQHMEQKFIDEGFSRLDIREMIKEFFLIQKEERVPYEDIKPILNFLEDTLGINPTRILNQWFVRYEDGELKTVTKKVYNDALELKKRTESALRSGSRYEVEKIREEIYGKKDGFTLFSEIEEELEFLIKFGKINPRRYLGRSISHYKKSRLKRIASWRASEIKDACSEVINKNEDLNLKQLPKIHRRIRLKKLLSVLKLNLISRVIKDDDDIENHILKPTYYGKKEYDSKVYGVISLNKAAYFLGMSKTAFDLLVAEHLDIVRKIGSYNKEWYLPHLYLRKIREKDGFDLIKAKYETLAKNYGKSHRPVEKTRHSIHVSEEKSHRHMA